LRAPIFSEKGKDIFLWCSAFQVFRQVAGLPTLGRGGRGVWGEFRRALAPDGKFFGGAIFFSLPLPPCAEKVKELP